MKPYAKLVAVFLAGGLMALAAGGTAAPCPECPVCAPVAPAQAPPVVEDDAPPEPVSTVAPEG